MERGAEVIIARRGRPVARLIRFETAVGERELGLDRGTFRVPENFDAHLTLIRADE